MTSPIQVPTLRPTDVVREPGLDQPQGELPALAKLLMAKGQLALEQEKFQNEMVQQKQKKQTLDQLNATLSGLFQGQPGGVGEMGAAAGALAGAGETGGAAAALNQIPAMQKQQKATKTQEALATVLEEYGGQSVMDPGVQAELLMHLAAVDPEAAFRVSEGLKNARGPIKAPGELHVNLGNDGGLYGTWMDADGRPQSKKLQDTGTKNAPNQQVARVAAAQTVQDIIDMEALLAKNPASQKVPTSAAMLEGAKMGGGWVGAIAGGLEPLAKGQYTSDQLQFRRLKLNFIDHYAAAVIGRRAAGSPATMKLVMDGFFPAAGEDQPTVQNAATALRARTKAIMKNLALGKPVDLSDLPGFAQFTAEQGGAGAPAPQAGAPGAAPLSLDDLLKGPPKP